MSEESNPLSNSPEQGTSSEEGKDDSISEGQQEVDQKVSVDETDELLQKILSDEEKKPEQKSGEDGSKEKEVDLSFLEKVSGRKFKDQAEFEKHYKNLSSLVGVVGDIDAKKFKEILHKAEEHDKIMKDAEEIESAMSNMTDEQKQQVQQKAQQNKESDEKIEKVDDRLQRLEKELLETKFLKSNPDAESVMGAIRDISSKTGKNYEEVYDEYGLKNLLADQKTLKEIQQKDLGVKSNSRVAPSKQQDIAGLVKQIRDVQASGNSKRGIEDLHQTLVRKVLDL